MEKMAIWKSRKNITSKPRQSEPTTRVSIRSESPVSLKTGKKSKMPGFLRPSRRPKQNEAPVLQEIENSALIREPESLEANPAPPLTASRKIKSNEVSNNFENLPGANPAYKPKHAASDFSQLRVSTNPDFLEEKQGIKLAELDLQCPLAKQSTDFNSVNKNGDYQNFVAQARVVDEQKIIIGIPTNANEPRTTHIMHPSIVPGSQPTTRRKSSTAVSPTAEGRKPSKIALPQSSAVMKDIYAKQHQAEKQRALSISQQPRQRMGSVDIVLEKMGSYIRPQSVRQINRQSVSSSSGGSTIEEDELPGLGFSAVGQSIRRSISVKREKESNPRSRAGSTSSNAGSGGRRRTLPPAVLLQQLNEHKELGDIKND